MYCHAASDVTRVSPMAGGLNLDCVLQNGSVLRARPGRVDADCGLAAAGWQLLLPVQRANRKGRPRLLRRLGSSWQGRRQRHCPTSAPASWRTRCNSRRQR